MFFYSFFIFCIFSCGHATLKEPLSVRPSVRPSVTIESKSGKTHISAPAHLSATDGRVSGLVLIFILSFFLPWFLPLLQNVIRFVYASTSHWLICRPSIHLSVLPSVHPIHPVHYVWVRNVCVKMSLFLFHGVTRLWVCRKDVRT